MKITAAAATSSTTTTTTPTLHTYKTLRRVTLNRIFGLTYTCAITSLLYHHTQKLLHSATLISAIMFIADIILAFMWATTQSFRVRPISRQQFPQNLHNVLSQRGVDFPAVDIFICTADPYKEPPMSVVNTALSVMAYDYPAGKISVYLSDDGGSELTLFAFIEAAKFAKRWLPFCKENTITNRCPDAFFTSNYEESLETEEIKTMYEKMKRRVEICVEKRTINEEFITNNQEKEAFSKWTSQELFTRQDHPTIIQVLLATEKDRDMPNLIYLSRQKSRTSPHHFKAGALNALEEIMMNCKLALVIRKLSLSTDFHPDLIIYSRVALLIVLHRFNK